MVNDGVVVLRRAWSALRGSLPIDLHSFQSSFMALGNGRHMLPAKFDIRKVIGKKAGDSVTVRLNERFW